MTNEGIPNLPPIECLAAAIVAARAGSFTQAAIEMGVSHAAVSRRIAGAESWAGTSLFVRHGRGVRLTDDGHRLLSRVSHAFDTIDQAVSLWRKPQRARQFKIATTHSLAQLWLMPRIATIEAVVPEVRIEVLTGPRHANLAVGEADIAIRCGKGGWKEGIEYRLFPEEHLYPVATPDCIARHAIGNEPAALLGHPLIHSVDSSGWHSWAQTRGSHYRGKLTDRIVSDYTLAISAAKAHLGVALANSGLVPPGDLDPCLKALDIPMAPSPLKYFLIVPSHQDRAVASAVVDVLRELGTDHKGLTTRKVF